jgi:hypothetical protein
MSFSIQTALASPDAAVEAVEAAFEAAPAAREAAGELVSQIAAIANMVAPTIARSGDQVIVSAYGHWNHGPEPVPGWSSNALTVSVTQVYPKAEEG